MTEQTMEWMTRLDQLLEERSYQTLIHELDELLPADAASFFSALPSSRRALVFRLLKKDMAAEIFAELDTDLQSELILAMSDKEASALLEELFVDDAVDLLEEMPAGIVKRLLRISTPETRSELNRFLSYPTNSTGSIMTSEMLRLDKDLTTEEAVARIRRIGEDKETVYVAYVTDHARVLLGVVPLKKLLFADPSDRIEDIMDKSVIYATTTDDREQTANLISRYGLLALPVVDHERRLVGIVTVDDALDVLETEATEDMERMAAILPNDRPYLKTRVWAIWKQRIPWLLLLMISATFTGMIIRHYEHAIGKYAILTAFLPMLMGTGGNAGGQSSVTVIRGLSLGEIGVRDALRVLWKELRVALLCGVTLAAAVFAKVMLFDFRLQGTTLLEDGILQNNLTVALVISLTVFLGILIAKAVGALLPIGAKAVRLDPAVMASPFVTTVVDTVTLMVYFAVATVLLPL